MTNPEALKGYLEEVLAPGAQQYEQVLRDAIAGRLPYGFLSAIARRSYGEALIKRAAGFLPVATADEEVAALEQDAASRALGGNVVIETSALNTLDLLGFDPADLLANFPQVLLPSNSLDDAIAGRESLDLRATAIVEWDTRSNRPVFVEIPDERAEEWANAADRLVQRARDFAIATPLTDKAPEPGTYQGTPLARPCGAGRGEVSTTRRSSDPRAGCGGRLAPWSGFLRADAPRALARRWPSPLPLQELYCERREHRRYVSSRLVSRGHRGIR